jgi:hypothetical protein
MVVNHMFSVGLILSSFEASASRIEKPVNNAVRCNSEALSQAECDEDRVDAINSGCISRTELEDLKKYNGCPICKRDKYKGWCPVGCFVRGSRILVWDTLSNSQYWMPVEEIVQDSKRYKVAALRKNATLSDLNYDYLSIRLTTVGPESKPLVMISTEGKRNLGVSGTHAMALSNGVVLAAQDLKVGDALLSMYGHGDLITSIERPTTEDDVFNLSVETDVNQSHLIIAEELYSGDQYLQDSFFLNTTLIH